jgi:hypothetical protein
MTTAIVALIIGVAGIKEGRPVQTGLCRFSASFPVCGKVAAMLASLCRTHCPLPGGSPLEQLLELEGLLLTLHAHHGADVIRAGLAIRE